MNMSSENEIVLNTQYITIIRVKDPYRRHVLGVTFGGLHDPAELNCEVTSAEGHPSSSLQGHGGPDAKRAGKAGPNNWA